MAGLSSAATTNRCWPSAAPTRACTSCNCASKRNTKPRRSSCSAVKIRQRWPRQTPGSKAGDSQMKDRSYAEYRRQHRWRENSLAHDDEDIYGRFDWKLIRRFGPYLARYRAASTASMTLMLVYTGLNIANPFLIGVAIDEFISRNNLGGLAIASAGLVAL